MRIDPTSLQTSNYFIKDYRNYSNDIVSKFNYNPLSDTTFQQRVADLSERTFNRISLSNVLDEVNRRWGASESSLLNVERLKDETSVVVIGGQQAGLLSGPLYTIHKIISIISMAKEQESKLGVPVIPVFWIAGEDHDFDEINHVMMPEGSRLKKHKISHRVNDKRSVSDLRIDKELTYQWVNSVFENLEETEFTKPLYEKVRFMAESSETYVDFFAKFIHDLFAEEGLVLVDSGDHALRRIESEFFLRIIENQNSISAGVSSAVQQSRQQGYSINLDVEPGDAHLFYHKDGDRVLLTRSEDGSWVGKQGECAFHTDELKQIAKYQPELLSNNVVTRPVMQELLFPSLAFIGGLGEIGYWSALKPAFEAMDIRMPPVIPRLSMTLVNRKVEKYIQQFSLSPSHAVNHGVQAEKANWLASQSSPPIAQLTEQIKTSVGKMHEPLRKTANEMRSDLGELAEKNLLYIFNDIDYLQDRMLKALQDKYVQQLSAFDMVDLLFHPEGGLQERSWNILYWLNEFGYNFIRQLSSDHYSFDEDHFLVYL